MIVLSCSKNMHKGYMRNSTRKVSKHCTCKYSLRISINSYSIPVLPHQRLAGNQILRQLSEPRLLCGHGSLTLLFARSTGMRPLKQATRLIKKLWSNETVLKFRHHSNVSSKQFKYSSPSMFFSISALIASNDEIFTAGRAANF